MSLVQKAVIPVAGYATRLFPASKTVKKEFFPIVDRAGVPKPIIQLIIEEAFDAGVEEVCLVVRPSDRDLFADYFQRPLPTVFDQKLVAIPELKKQAEHILELGKRLSYVEQPSPEGFGHAVYCAKDWVGDEPFMVLLGDHLYVSRGQEPCARQLIDAFDTLGGPVSAVAVRPERALGSYGTIAGARTEENPRIIRVSDIFEKPDVDYARRYLKVPGLPDGYYLCWFGQHVFTQGIFDALRYLVEHDIRERGEIQLTTAQKRLLDTQGEYYAFETEGDCFDTGTPWEYVNAMLHVSGHEGKSSKYPSFGR